MYKRVVPLLLMNFETMEPVRVGFLMFWSFDGIRIQVNFTIVKGQG